MIIWIKFGKYLEIVGNLHKKYNCTSLVQKQGKANSLNKKKKILFREFQGFYKNVEYWTKLDVFPLLGIQIYSSFLLCEIDSIDVLIRTFLLVKCGWLNII